MYLLNTVILLVSVNQKNLGQINTLFIHKLLITLLKYNYYLIKFKHKLFHLNINYELLINYISRYQ